ncbi:MAG TPA: alpha/beta fold hydrolase, partial [Burkholderiaceae bacterium]|nr:alpha/beta fold hydrolase [Burkholderiaceae bacterium]
MTSPSDKPTRLSQRAAPAWQAADNAIRNRLAKTAMGLSPIALTRAYMDWALQMSVSPGRRSQLGVHAFELMAQAWQNMLDTSAAEHASDNDLRFRHESWKQWPYNLFKESFRATESWWQEAVCSTGMTQHNQQMVAFFAQQAVDAMSPSNWLATNPEVLQTAIETQGQSLVRGWELWVKDQRTRVRTRLDQSGEALEPLPFAVGKDVAVTPGKVVWRNHLFELIQYEPMTDKVCPEPVLIIPSCIMKYYILDLSPHNSMVKYLVSQGHTVLIMSWRNPDASDANLKIQDYLSTGLMQAMAATRKVTGASTIHTIGYCLGGTFLAMVGAILGRLSRVPEKDWTAEEKALVPTALPEMASMTLLAAQTDFTEPGELGVFIDEEQLTMLRQSMFRQGFLSGRQMAGSFQFLASRDLVWSQNVRRYLLGQENSSFDLLSWNQDVTRLPARMHDEYLTALFLNNNLVNGQYRFAGKSIALVDLTAPLMVVGTTKDHVSPWRSVYKIHLYTNVPITFVLAAGGHNAGIVSEPGRPRRSYQIDTTEPGQGWTDPAIW